MPNWTQIRKALAQNPRKTAGGTAGVSFLALLIPTLIKLIPLDKNKRHAQEIRDHAQDDYDSVANQYANAKENIRIAKQRVIDLDCAMQGYQGFNQGITAFQKAIADSTASPMDKLALLWKLRFDSDHDTVEQWSDRKSWDQLDYVYDYHYSCSHQCDKDTSCCYGWGWHYVTQAHYYTEHTTLVNKLKNIIQGNPYDYQYLNCGYYSRRVSIAKPENYITYESGHVDSGNRDSGHTYVNFYREYGSRVTISYLLDESNVNNQIVVPRETDQANAAIDVTNRLYQFLTLAIGAFNVVGADYPQLQDTIRNSIPGLIETAATINNTLQAKASILANEESIYSKANSDYHTGLSIWLPIFFLVPGGLALLAYFIASRCLDINESNDIENPAVSYHSQNEPDKVSVENPPPYSTHSFFNKEQQSNVLPPAENSEPNEPPPAYSASV